MKWHQFLDSHCTQQALEAKRLPRAGELGVQQTEFPLSSQEALVKWGLELIWFPPIKIICSTQKSHKVPIKARALAHWITLAVGLAQGWGAAGTGAAQGAPPACGTRAVGCADPPKSHPGSTVSCEPRKATQRTGHKPSQKVRVLALLPQNCLVTAGQGWVEGGMGCKCHQCHLLEKQLLQHTKEPVLRWCKSAQLHWAVVIYTSWGMDQRHLLRLQCI